MEAILRTDEAQFDQDLAAFFGELSTQARYLQRTEPVRSALYAATPVVYDSTPAFAELVNDFVATEPIKHPSYRVNKYYQLNQFPLLDDEVRDFYSFPRRFRKAGAWQSWLESNFSRADQMAYQQVDQMRGRRLQNNRYQRANAVAFVGHLLRQPRADAFYAVPSAQPADEPFVIHEHGSAGNIIGNAIAMRHYSWVTSLDRKGHTDRLATSFFNSINRTFTADRIYGIEVEPPKTPEDRLWQKSNTMDPSRLDRDQIKRLGMRGARSHESTYDILATSVPEEVITIEGDALDLSAEQAALLQNDPADIAFLSHSLAQNIEDIERMVESARAYLKPHGALVVNEYANVDPDDRTRLIVVDSWYRRNFLCKTIVRLAEHWDEGYIPIMDWSNAHCEVVKLRTRNIGKLATAFSGSNK